MSEESWEAISLVALLCAVAGFVAVGEASALDAVIHFFLK
jgi:hypothetical protein